MKTYSDAQLAAISHHNKLSNQVIVDHLAFTVPLPAFKHLERAGKDASHRNQWCKMPSESWRKVDDPDLKQSMIDDYQAECGAVFFTRLKQFMLNICGLKISPARDKGLHGYTNSHRLLDSSGRVELGFVGIGGNNNTVYIQISGEGCKHVFDEVTPFVLHFWLSSVLTVNTLSRIDLAYDDFDGNYCTEYAEKAYFDEAFKNPNGGRMPEFRPDKRYVGTELIGDTIYIGSRKSAVYWRIYNKAMEQGLPGQVWYRNEVELKKVSVDTLKNPALAFAGLNRFASSVNIEHGTCTYTSKKRAALDFAGRVRWARQQVGRTLSDILEAFDGDIFAAFGAVCDSRGGKFSIPDTQGKILHSIITRGTTHEDRSNRL